MCQTCMEANNCYALDSTDSKIPFPLGRMSQPYQKVSAPKLIYELNMSLIVLCICCFVELDKLIAKFILKKTGKNN